MKMIDHNHFICHLIWGTFTEYPYIHKKMPYHYFTAPIWPMKYIRALPLV